VPFAVCPRLSFDTTNLAKQEKTNSAWAQKKPLSLRKTAHNEFVPLLTLGQAKSIDGQPEHGVGIC
ncbi:MAG: hypothetical protein ACOYD3_07305, partial [Kiritimatiellia bacterium]